MKNKKILTLPLKPKILNALQNSESRFRRLFEAAQDGIFILDAVTGQINEVNPFLVDILGYSREELLGKKLWEVGTFTDTAKSKESFKKIQREGYVRYEDMPLQTKEGLLIRVEFVSNLYVVDGKKVIQCNIRDITERKKMEAIIEQRRVILEHKFKSQLIADISHELRTPLAIIRGTIDLAAMDKTHTKSQKTVYKSITEEIKTLSNMLADLSLLTSDKVEFRKIINHKKVNLKKMLERLALRSKSLAHKKNISINLKKMIMKDVIGDEVLLERLFLNLIKNAITYGRRDGFVEVTGSNKDRTTCVSVTDNGIGISKKNLFHVFERFFRADRSRTHANGELGSGLGLSIAKWIVEVHRGTIHVESVENIGSSFVVSLPMAKGS